MVSRSSVVVVARYDGKRRVEQRSEGDYISTTYTFAVQEVIKRHDALPGVVDLRLPAGDVEHPTHIERARTAGVTAALLPGRYLIFLNYHAPSKQWVGAWGPASIYDVSGDRVKLIATEVRRNAERPVAEFLAEVRSAAGR
jgi:hypothetical protein